MNYTCPKCTSPFTEKTKFCKICGCNLHEELIEKPTCPKCNTVFSYDIKFCIQDGTKLVHPDKLIPKCVVCKKLYTNGTKFCPNDGGEIKLEDDILLHRNANTTKSGETKSEETKSSYQETTAASNPQPNYNITKTYNKAPLGKRFLAYLLDGLIIAALFLPSLFFLFDFFIGILDGYYDNYISEQNIFFGLLLIFFPLRYALIKDGIGEGQSYGKSAVDLMVINVNTNKPCTKMNSAGRNLLSNLFFSIPYIGSLIEIIMVFANPEGRKLSDLGAATQVIDKNEYNN